MATFSRHMLAAVLFGLCVLSLAVGWRFSRESNFENRWFHQFSTMTLWCKWRDGEVQVSLADGVFSRRDPTALEEGEILCVGMQPDQLEEIRNRYDEQGRFGAVDSGFYCPYWYPPLVFASATVGALTLGRQFTIRAALIATTVVAGLLGVAVAL